MACLSTLLSPSPTTRLVWLVGCVLLLFAANAYAGQVSFVWDAVRAPNLGGYRLHYGQSSHTYSAHLDVGLQTTATVTGLTAGQTYYFAVTAYDSTGKESPFSNEVSTTLSAPVPPPVAAFSASPTSGPAPVATAFTDASTGTVTAWAWDFGDGTSSPVQHPTHTYTTPGTYTVQLTVTGPGGSNTTTKTGYITVTAPMPPAPVANFSASLTSGRVPLKVAFTDASTGTVTAWVWNFGDGTSSAVQHPSHTYTTPGTYTVQLTVTGPGGSNTTTKTGYVKVAPALLEVGDLTIDYVWKRVTLRQKFVDPIVVAAPLSANDFTPATIRIRNVGPTGFDIRIQEWDYLDGTHMPETVSYLAMERGAHVLGNGIRVEAGRLATDETLRHPFAAVKFRQAFGVAPVVMSAVTSVNEASAVTMRVRKVTRRGFEVAMQEQIHSAQTHATESIDYIAWQPSSGTVDGLTFEVKTTPNAVTDDIYTLKLTEHFLATPMFLAGLQTTNDWEPIVLRLDDKNPVEVRLQLQEEASATWHDLHHPAEVVGYMAFTYQ